MRFAKAPLTLEQQLNLLIERGLQCRNRQQALHFLGHLNYYRLGGYWLPFESDHIFHRFAPGTQFEDVLNLYIFDRELRLLIMDAIERVEVSVRTGWAYHLAHHYGPHAHLDAAIFKKPTRNWDYVQQLAKLQEDSRRSHEAFIQHHFQKYDEPVPPLWAVVEIMTLGQLSKWYDNLLHRADRNAVAHRYDMDEVNFSSFLHHLTIIRNLCAHHSRLWNREITFTFKLPTHRPAGLVTSLNTQNSRRIYNTLTTLIYLMNTISPDNQWKQRLKALLGKHQIDVSPMGFPTNFSTNPIWSDN